MGQLIVISSGVRQSHELLDTNLFILHKFTRSDSPLSVRVFFVSQKMYREPVFVSQKMYREPVFVSQKIYREPVFFVSEKDI